MLLTCFTPVVCLRASEGCYSEGSFSFAQDELRAKESHKGRKNEALYPYFVSVQHDNPAALYG